MSQTIAKDSTGLQAGGDIHIKTGLNFSEVEKLFKLLFKENFPQLKAEAMEVANNNVQLFLKEFERKLKEKHSFVDPEKFKDPDIQYSLTEAIVETAKRGDKSNLDILANLVIQKTYTNQNDLQSLAASEAIKVVGRLTREQINLMCIESFISNMILPNCKSLKDFEASCFLIKDLFPELCTLSDWNLQYLESQKCIILHRIITSSSNLINLLQKKYKLNNFSKDELRKQIDSTVHFKRLVEIYEKKKLYRIDLTITGQLISAINIDAYMPNNMDFTQYIK